MALNYVASEVHANFGPLFGPLSAENKAVQIDKLDKKFKYITEHMLNGQDYLVGNKFSIADIYLYIVLSWGQWVGVDVSAYPTVHKFYQRIAELPAVKEAHAKMATSPSST